MPFGQHQDTELWNNQFPETKILGLPVSWRMRGLVCVASRYKADVDTFHKGIQYPLEKLGKSKFRFERTAVSNFKSKRHEDSGNEISPTTVAVTDKVWGEYVSVVCQILAEQNTKCQKH